MRVVPLLAVAGLVLAGCTTVPEAIRKPPADDLQLAAVRPDPERYRDAVVRWGGLIAGVRNDANETVIEIVGRRLDSQGRPRDEDRSEGRFLARVGGFLDPAVYANSRELTVRGVLEGAVEQPIGEYRYRYPKVRVEQLYLWPVRLPPDPYYYRYDPYWTYPWYPWSRPYYYPYPRKR